MICQSGERILPHYRLDRSILNQLQDLLRPSLIEIVVKPMELLPSRKIIYMLSEAGFARNQTRRDWHRDLGLDRFLLSHLEATTKLVG